MYQPLISLCFQPDSWLALRNDLIGYIVDLRSSGQFNSALAKLIMSSTGVSHDTRESGNLIRLIIKTLLM